MEKQENKINKYNTKLCNDEMKFEECEIAILRHAVDETEKIQGEKIANNDEIKHILSILEDFLIRKKLVCYGGTAINNILPSHVQFYNRDIEIPDYDFYSSNALEDAKELADIYYKSGYLDVEAKSGVHVGTYKVFVNFIGVADITFLHKGIFDKILKESIVVSGIHYAPANFLRMNMYLELSRPAGDVSRWEKILKRLVLLNKYYPLQSETDCQNIDFQRKMDNNMENSEKIYFTIRDSFISQGVIFFGGYATRLYSKYMKYDEKQLIKKIPDFDVLSEEPNTCANIVKEQLKNNNFKNVKIINHKGIREIIPEHVEIRIGNDTLAFIYKPIACHSYNEITMNENIIKIASIDTILSFYLAFIYTELPYYSKERLLCMAKFLFDVEEKNKLEQKGLLKRFSINCYGKQMTMEEIRSEKAKKYKELMNNKNSPEYQKWFLKYTPSTNSETNDNKEIKEEINEKNNNNERKKKTYKKRTRNNTTRKYRNIFGKKSDYLY